MSLVHDTLYFNYLPSPSSNSVPEAPPFSTAVSVSQPASKGMSHSTGQRVNGDRRDALPSIRGPEG
ncbi:hypothetical protein DL98DRAFT_515890 [Cadophora sp. DSE1049]|nr:hypothetical protein DL98DRAFT_515890 [Cadophora sp. DSE1049]